MKFVEVVDSEGDKMVIMLDKLVSVCENDNRLEIFLVGQVVPMFLTTTYDKFVAKLKGGSNE